MTTGWVKTHRKMTEQFWYRDSEHVHLFLHLLFKASHARREWMYKGRQIIINEGQFISSRKSLSQETGINESKIERVLKCFENDNQIEQQNLYTSRLITVVNYKSYQQNEHEMNSKRTASEQQMNTNKNYKNDKNVKNKDSAHARVLSNTPQADFVKKFSDIYEKNAPGTHKTDKKDFVLIANLLKKHSVDELQIKAALLAIYCEQGEIWFARNGWADFTIGNLVRNWNSIVPVKTAEQKKRDKMEDLLAREEARNAMLGR